MNTTVFGQAVIDNASMYVTPEDLCYEETYNKGNCITLLKCSYAGIKTNCTDDKVGNEAYCALAVSVWIRDAENMLSLGNSLSDKIRTKGALDLINKCKSAGIRVDKNPVPGCIFYRYSSAPGASGHVGIVSYVNNKYVYTIEANGTFTYKGESYDGVWGWYYPKSDFTKRGFQFAHTETYYGKEYVDVQVAVNDAGVYVSESGSGTNYAGFAKGWVLPSVILVAGLGFMAQKYDWISKFKKMLP